MPRAYAGVLGAIALNLAIVRGLFVGFHPDEILGQAVVFFGLFACLGYCIGFVAEKTVSESVENRFRSEMASLHAAAAEKTKTAEDRV